MTKTEHGEASEMIPLGRRSQARARETGEKILAAALKEFAEHGFAGASTRAVASAAGVQHPLVNYHFKSKEGLWHAVLEATAGQFMQQFRTRLAGLRGVDDVTKLRLVQEDFIRFSAENPHFHALMSQAGRHPSKQLNAMVNEFVRPYFTTIGALIRSAQSIGCYVEGDPEHLQYLFIGATTRIFTLAAEVKLITGVSPFSATMLDRHVVTCLNLFFREQADKPAETDTRRSRQSPRGRQT
jgi:AcrR family transcriptional regulator